MSRGNLGWAALLGAWTLACGARAIGEPARNEPAAATPGPIEPQHATPASLPPGYGDGTPRPAPSPALCVGCRTTRVVISSEAGTDTVSMCAVPPAGPVKPFDSRGTLLRSSVKGCDPDCCP